MFYRCKQEKMIQSQFPLLIFLAFLSTYGISHSDDDWIDNIESLACHVSAESGLYGLQTTNEQSIQFYYDLEYSPEGDIDDILNDVETTIGNYILRHSSLFQQCTITRRERRVKRIGETSLKVSTLSSSTSSSRNLSAADIVGLSTRPIDTHSLIECPSDAVSTDSTCVSVDAELRLYFEEGAQHLQDTGVVRSSIRNLMHVDGLLVNEDTQIRKIDYYDSRAQGATFTLSASGTGAVIIGASLGVVLLALFGYKWKQKRQESKTSGYAVNHGIKDEIEGSWE